MKKGLFYFAFIMILIGCIGISVLHAEEDIIGTWMGTTYVPDMGDVGLTLVLEKIDEGYIGKISDTSGILDNTEVSDIDFTNNELTFTFIYDNGYGALSIDMVLKTEGNKMTGYWQVDSDSAVVELEKKV